MNTTRRGFFGLLAGVAAGATAISSPPQYQHVAYGFRPDRTLGPYVEWRNYTWWLDEAGARLRWALSNPQLTELNRPECDWLICGRKMTSLRTESDKLWIETPRGWMYFTFDRVPLDGRIVS